MISPVGGRRVSQDKSSTCQVSLRRESRVMVINFLPPFLCLRRLREPNNEDPEQGSRQHRQKRAEADGPGEEGAHGDGVEADVDCTRQDASTHLPPRHHSFYCYHFVQESSSGFTVLVSGRREISEKGL